MVGYRSLTFEENSTYGIDFLSLPRSMSTWIQDKREELAAADMVRGIPEEVQNQITEVEVHTRPKE